MSPVYSPDPRGPRSPHPGRTRTLALVLAAAALGLVVGCGENPGGPGDSDPTVDLQCSIPTDQIADGGVGRGGIPALSDPELVSPGGSGTEYLRAGVSADPEVRVIGLRAPDGQPIAVPHRILWWHEIVNFDFGDRKIAVTLCPLTGSSLAFDRAAVDGREFVVSGLLYLNNLMMAPAEGGRTLYPQMSRGGRCGPDRGVELEQVHVTEMSWEQWKSLHPDTRVISSSTGFQRDYTDYPYGSYNSLGNSNTLFPVPRIDGRRPPKELVLGIPHEDGGLAVPFGALQNTAEVALDSVSVGGEPVWVFWKAQARSAAAYRPEAVMPSGETRTASFTLDGGEIVDRETGSVWTLDGRAVSGPMEGAELEPVREAYPAFWFAWALFQPETEIWEPPS